MDQVQVLIVPAAGRIDPCVRPLPALNRAGVRPGSTRPCDVVDDWDEMAVEERRRALSHVFERIVVGADAVTELPYEEWRPYMRAVLERPRVLPRVPTERKTGLLRARCTPRVVRITERDRIVVEGTAAA